MSKDKDYNRLIHTTRWLMLRRDKLTVYPLCEVCQAQGRIRPATEVHHVKPVEDAITLREKERLMYDYHNLQALCHECHVQAHRDLGKWNKEQTKRRTQQHLERFKQKFL